MNNVCYVRVYKVYPDRRFYYYGLPPHYYTYRGAHARAHCGGVSYYKKNFRKYYNHKVYAGHYQCRPEHRPHDFGMPEPPVRPPRQVCPPSRPLPPSVSRPPKHDNDKYDRYERRNERKEKRSNVRKPNERNSSRSANESTRRIIREI